MIDGSEKRNRQLAFELQNSHVCEKRSKAEIVPFRYPLRHETLFYGINKTVNLYILTARTVSEKM